MCIEFFFRSVKYNHLNDSCGSRFKKYNDPFVYISWWLKKKSWKICKQNIPKSVSFRCEKLFQIKQDEASSSSKNKVIYSFLLVVLSSIPSLECIVTFLFSRNGNHQLVTFALNIVLEKGFHFLINFFHASSSSHFIDRLIETPWEYIRGKIVFS